MKPRLRNKIISRWLLLTIACLFAVALKAQTTIHIVAQIDGGDYFTIQQDKITWQHVNFGNPIGPVIVNGISWDLQETNTLWNSGSTTYMTNQVDFLSAIAKRTQGRDTLALRLTNDSAVVEIADTPNGDSIYDFDVIFDSIPTLTILANIDGSDELHISSAGATWLHKSWGWPGDVSVNGVSWNPQTTEFLPNYGPTAFLPRWVNLGSARIASVTTRDLLQIETTKDGVIVYFADNPVGAGLNAVTLAFNNSATNILSRPTVAATAQFALAQKAGVSFGTKKDALYALEYATNLMSPNWVAAQAFVIGDGGTMTLFDPIATATNRYYRVVSKSSAE